MGGCDEREDEPVLVLYKHRQRWVAAAREDRPGIRWEVAVKQDKSLLILYKCGQMCVVAVREYKPTLVLYKCRQRSAVAARHGKPILILCKCRQRWEVTHREDRPVLIQDKHEQRSAAAARETKWAHAHTISALELQMV